MRPRAGEQPKNPRFRLCRDWHDWVLELWPKVVAEFKRPEPQSDMGRVLDPKP